MPPPPGQSFSWEPSPGLRPFLIVMLVIGDVLSGLLALAGALAFLQYLGFLGGSTTPGDAGSFALIAFFLVLFALTLGATIGVLRRTGWARVVALVDGALFCLTCLGVVIGIPILVAAARAPIKKRQAAPAP